MMVLMKCVTELNNKKMKKILLSICEENSKLLFTNPSSVFILGIGSTDYTIHRDAREISDYYRQKTPKYWYDLSDGQFNITHYFEHNLKTILLDCVKREFLKCDGEVYKILDIKIEIPNKIETYIELRGRRNDTPELKYRILTDKLSDDDKFWFNVTLEKDDTKGKN